MKHIQLDTNVVLVLKENNTLGIDQWKKLAHFAVAAYNRIVTITTDGKVTFWEVAGSIGLVGSIIGLIKNAPVIAEEAKDFTETELLEIYAILQAGLPIGVEAETFFKGLLVFLMNLYDFSAKFQPKTLET